MGHPNIKQLNYKEYPFTYLIYLILTLHIHYNFNSYQPIEIID